MEKNKIAVIGGGPAGILAAGIASDENNQVTLFEQNEKLGKKLYITGKGRCNITNNKDIEDFFDNIVTNKNFLYSSLYSFTNKDIINLIESNGVKTKVEQGQRVFPKSDKSSDVIKAFERFLLDKSVKIKYNHKVNSIFKENEYFTINTDKGSFNFNKVIIATGGKSYPATGSRGSGYIFAKKFGHEIIPIKPALIDIKLNDDFIKELTGLTLRNISLKCKINGKKIYEDLGDLLFTHKGISGPLVLSLSSYINRLEDENISLEIDFKPGLNKEQLDKRILRDFSNNSNRDIINGLNQLLPNRIIEIILNKSKIDIRKKINQITQEERLNLIENIKGFKLDFDRLKPIDYAIISSGGVNTLEIDPSTMESKIIKNLYFAGEIIDVDALTGGYNLQIAYSTGFLAGNNAKELYE